MPDSIDKGGSTTDLVPAGQSGSLVPTETPITAGSASAGKAIPIRTTAPEELLRHNISDEQLDMLAEGKRDGMSEAFWAFIAGGIGGMPAAGEALVNAFWHEPAVAISPYHLLEIVIVAGCFAVASAIKIMWRRKAKSTSDLVDRIRAQGKSGATPQ